MRILLVDGDLLLYQYGFRGQTDFNWGEGLQTRITSKDVAIGDLKGFISKMKADLEADRIIVCLTGSRPFRYDILSSYKHTRKAASKPELYTDLKEYMLQHYETMMKPHLEADDCLGIMGTRKIRSATAQTIICTIDKDLEQIPGYHFNWFKDQKVRTVDEHTADMCFYLQALMGDSTDGYSGCPGIGKKKAAKILEAVPNDKDWHKRIWEAIVQAYEAKGLNESYALTQARMARILRACDYSFPEDHPILWSPCK